MKYFSSNEGFLGMIGRSKKARVAYVDSGDFRTTFLEDETFLICRRDGELLNGTEDLHALTYVDDRLVPLIHSKYEEMISRCIESYDYHLENPRPFFEFDLKLENDNSRMIIYPVYLDNTPNIMIDMDSTLDEDLGDIGFSFGTVKVLRNVILGDKIISGEEKSTELVKRLRYK